MRVLCSLTEIKMLLDHTHAVVSLSHLVTQSQYLRSLNALHTLTIEAVGAAQRTRNPYIPGVIHCIKH